jgi:uncharacterized protein (DUF1810 family)
MTANDLQRFISAQDAVMAQVDAELSVGRKQTHWMWFVFPQLAGLGHSTTAKFFALADIDHARRYLADPVLGGRLRQHVRLLLGHKDKTAREITGAPDDLKLRSCLTLFMAASGTREDRELFEQGLQQFFGGRPDPRTLELIA